MHLNHLRKRAACGDISELAAGETVTNGSGLGYESETTNANAHYPSCRVCPTLRDFVLHAVYALHDRLRAYVLIHNYDWRKQSPTPQETSLASHGITNRIPSTVSGMSTHTVTQP